jgi:hypothetical protein
MSDDRKTVTWNDLETLQDRTQDPRPVCTRLLDVWGYDLDKRKPGVAFVDAEGIPVTDLDLAAFMTPLVENRTVINVPKYKSRRAASVREGDYITSKDNRHGRLSGLTSKQGSFSFGIRIDDLNVIQVTEKENGETDTEVGAFRVLLLQDVTGDWYEGWSTIDILPNGLPREIFKKLSGAAAALKFQYFIHPNRWPSFYGKYYAFAKAAIVRLEDQMRHMRSETGRLRKELDIPPKKWGKSTKVGEEESIKVWAFEAFVDGIELTKEYEAYETTREAYDTAVALQKRLNALLEQLRFLTRATEYAFWKHAVCVNVPEDDVLDWLKGKKDGAPRRPSWTVTAGKAWETGFKIKKTYFARMPLKNGLMLRWRVWKKSERVAKDS